jgi:hypothetical protein
MRAVLLFLLSLVVLSLVMSGRRRTDQSASVDTTPAPASADENECGQGRAGLPASDFRVRQDLSLERHAWSLSEFSVATWTLRVKNSSRCACYKDFHFKTTYAAASGTQVDESVFGHTQYVALPPGKSTSFSFTEFTHSQAKRASIYIDAASYCSH